MKSKSNAQSTAMVDARNRCKATPPGGKGSRPVVAHLAPDDYRLLYELTMQRGVSMADTIRQIIREAARAKHQKPAGPAT